MLLSWWWCLPLGLGAALAVLARRVTTRLRAETEAVRDAGRALGLELGRARRSGQRPAADPLGWGESRPSDRPDTYLDIR